jgi:(p)ppGpp synthase/HD superfamily hydrolase
MNDLETLTNLVLAPYILKATKLIAVHRKVGGNQFRHCFSTLGILLDYKYYHEGVLLKASLLHDILEDMPDTGVEELAVNDPESWQVIELVKEVTRQQGEEKQVYLERLLNSGSQKALVLKCADRISNLTDLHTDTHDPGKFRQYLDQTEKYVIPMAEKVNGNMVKELKDLVKLRREILSIAKVDHI